MNETKWIAWRRRRGTRELWQQATFIPAGTRGDVHQAVAELDLKGYEDMIWEYQVMPVGKPPQGRPTFSKTLRNGR